MQKRAHCQRDIGELEPVHKLSNAVLCEICHNELKQNPPTPSASAPPPLPYRGQNYQPYPPPPDDTIATIVPYRNVPALLAYYIGLFSFIPCIGSPMGIAAFILGIKGLKIANANPNAKGKGHAIFGIIMGSIFGTVYTIGLIIMIIALLTAPRLISVDQPRPFQKKAQMSEPIQPLPFPDAPNDAPPAPPALPCFAQSPPQKKPRVWPSYVLPFALLAAYFAIGILLGVALYFYAASMTASPEDTSRTFEDIIRKPSVLFWLQVGTLAINALAIATLLFFSKTPRRQRINLHAPNVSIITLIVFAIGSLTFSSFYSLIQYHLQYRSASLEALGHLVDDSGLIQKIAAAILISVIGPILEELIFRGYIQTRLVQRHGPILGILITSACFGFIHFDLAQGTFAFFFGIFLGLVAWKTRSILPAIICHITLNSFSTVENIFQIDLQPYEIPRLIACCIILPAALTLLFLIPSPKAAALPDPAPLPA